MNFIKFIQLWERPVGAAWHGQCILAEGCSGDIYDAKQPAKRGCVPFS
jgi:hypothetical protein